MNLPATQSDATPLVSRLAGWTLTEFATVDSTNLVAGNLDAWNAVRAATQTAGRGRFSRSWVSDGGGLWLSAVVPTGADRRAIPMVAGLALIESLRKIGVPRARMRWPNDVMVDGRKLAGVLVDSFMPRRAVIGIGVNVTNHPDALDPALKDTATRLADFLAFPPSLAELTQAFLVTLRSVVEQVADAGFGSVRGRINDLWGGPRRVTLDLDSAQRSGVFIGVDESGRMLLQDDTNGITAFDPHEVKLLREL